MFDVLILLGAGLAAGYVAGLIGIGGGVIFAPVLLYYFEASGVPPAALPALAAGTSLLCTLVAALASASFQYREGAVVPRVALVTGLSSGVAVFLMARYVTTQPWYTKEVFQLVFAVLLTIVVVRMLRGREAASAEGPEQAGRSAALAGVGSVAGVVAAAVGVGGGVILVPAYHNLLRLPMHRAIGTSSATIVLISTLGVASYVLAGASGAPGAVGYVDFGRGLLLALPSIAGARLGVWTAHRIDTKALRWCFAALAVFVAGRMFVEALV